MTRATSSNRLEKLQGQQHSKTGLERTGEAGYGTSAFVRRCSATVENSQWPHWKSCDIAPMVSGSRSIRSASTLVTPWAFEHAADKEGGGVARGAVVAGPDGYGADDVDEAGFVFELEEGDAVGAAGALAVGDDAGDGDACVVLDGGQPRGVMPRSLRCSRRSWVG